MTQKETLLKYLKENGSITSLECVTKLFIIDLQGVVRDLKQDGYTILSHWIKKTNMYGQKKRFKAYYLIQDSVDFANYNQLRNLLKNKHLC
tara:strand:+ start:2071 stop:2343 length:273 start_codon:yes stop_codon:yes gene_type:complete